jgi:hypothetical protein
MTQKELAAIIAIMRRAPLANMAEAEGVALLIDKLQKHFPPTPAEEAPETPQQ